MTGDVSSSSSSSNNNIKQRLQKVWNLSENQLCSDCNAKRPTWASLIIPPQDAPSELQIIVGAFVCFQCSGIHRSLGTHICFVRSVNLDEWKEKEVLAMEMGGNNRVNAIFEAKDIHIGNNNNNNGSDSKSNKLDHMADMETRKKFIQDKYVHKKYFNAFYYDRVLRESTRSTTATPTHVEDINNDDDDVDHTFDANWDHFEKQNNNDNDNDDQDEEPTSSSTTTENLETPSAVISNRERPSRSMSRSSTNSGDSSTRPKSRSRSQKRRSRSKGGGSGRRHRSSRSGDNDTAQDKLLKSSSTHGSTHGSTCSSAAAPFTSDDDDDDDDASSFCNDDEPSSSVGGGDNDKKHHHSLGGYTLSSSTNNRSRGGGNKPKDPLSVSDHGSVGGGRARMRRQLAAGIKLQRTTSLRSFGGASAGGSSLCGGSGRGGGIQLGGDLAADDKNGNGSVLSRRSGTNHRRSGGLDSLSVSEHGGSSSGGRPRMRRQMSRQRIPTRSKSDFDDSHSLPTTKAGNGGNGSRRRRRGFDDDDEEEEEMVHIIQNTLSVTSEPVLSGGNKKAGASLFGNKNSNRPGLRRSSSSNRLRSSKSSLDRSRHSGSKDDDQQGEIGKSNGRSTDSRPPLRRMCSVRTKGSERNNSFESNSSGKGKKNCFGERGNKTNDEEEEGFVHHVVGSEFDSDSDNDDGDDDNSNKASGRRRTSGSRRDGDGGGISSDRRARSIERARGRERKKSTSDKSDEAGEEVVVEEDQAQTDSAEKNKPKSFDFATKRKTRPRSYDAKSNRRRNPSGRSDMTKTATKRHVDGKQQPQDVTNVFKAPIGQSIHSQNSGFSSGDESFLDFGEDDLFDEERRPNPISQRVVMGSSFQSMNSSFGSIDSFADTPEIENKVLIEVPVDP